MYKDGMSVSEVTCYFYASATYSYPRHVAYRHCYTSAAYLYGHAYSGATHAYSGGTSNADTMADDGINSGADARSYPLRVAGRCGHQSLWALGRRA